MQRILMLSVITALLGSSLAGTWQAKAADVEGTVTDGSVNRNGKGLDYVQVVIKLNDTKTSLQTLTDADGHYVFHSVPAGNYTVEFSRGDCVKYPTEKDLTIGNDSVKGFDCELIRKGASVAYYSSLAADWTAKAQRSQDPNKSLQQDWTFLKDIGLPPSDIQKVAVGFLQANDNLSGRVPGIKQYAHVDSQKILDFDGLVKASVDNQSSDTHLMALNNVKLPAAVAQDIIVFRVSNSDVSGDESKVFLNKLRGQGFELDDASVKRIEDSKTSRAW